MPQIAGLEAFEPIAQSSTAVTWRAYQRTLERHVMVKMLLPEAVANRGQVDLFLSVARALSRVKAESFCQIFDISASADGYYVIIEDAAGKTLAEHVQENPRLPSRTVLRYALGIAEALGKAWESERFVHRNLKPTTIHITAEGVAKLTDFGHAFLAKPGVDIDRLDGGMVVGTPNFIAPEQVDHTHGIDCRSDMYALGAVLYFALTGQIPFGDQPPEKVIRSQIEDLLPNPRTLRPDLPLSVCLLLERLLMKHPGHRYAAWGEVVADIKRLLDGKPLRRSPLLGAGLSTLAAPAGEDAGAPAPRPAPAARPAGPGGFFRFLLWMLLMAWLFLFANHRLGDPLDLYPLLRARLPGLVPYLPPSQSRPPLPPQPPATSPALRVLPPPVSAVAAPADAVAPSPPAQPPVVPEPPPDRALHRALADACARDGVRGLRAQLDARLAINDANPRLRAIRDTLGAVEPLDQMAARALERAVGREIDLIFNGKTRKVVPREVAGGKVSLFFGEQNRTVTLDLATLGDAEMIRLLKTPLEPHQAAAVALRLLETGERVAARPYAAAAGPLAPILTLLADPES